MAHVIVLCYHAVSTTWDSELAVTPEQLRHHVGTLLRHGYRPATFHEAVVNPPAQRTLAVTFDDGYRSMRELAYPVLSKLGVPATVFMPTDFIGLDGPMSWPGVDGWLGTPHEKELLPMDWDDLRWLTWRGWEIGSHTCSHPHLPTTRDDQVERELSESKAVLEQWLQRPCPSLAYPYGGLSPRVVAAARKAGYETAAALWHPMRDHEALTWPRVAIYRDDAPWRVALKTSVRLRQLRANLGRSAGRTAYSALGS
jgi:peptidoglycan/xylan/chitin deacetylase (PgdA/CDA1 family)